MNNTEFQTLLDSFQNSIRSIVNEQHFCIHLNGKWRWRYYKNYLYNFGWCIEPADEEAKESLRKANRWTTYSFVKVYRKDGSYEEVKLPSRVYDDNPYLYWFEYGVESISQFKSRVKRNNKLHKWNHTIVEFNADDIPKDWWITE